MTIALIGIALFIGLLVGGAAVLRRQRPTDTEQPDSSWVIRAETRLGCIDARRRGAAARAQIRHDSELYRRQALRQMRKRHGATGE